MDDASVCGTGDKGFESLTSHHQEIIMDITEHAPGLYSVKSNIDLTILKRSVNDLYEFIKETFAVDNVDYDRQSTLDTDLFTKYNLCMYPLPGIHELYWSIHSIFHECLTRRCGIVNEKYFMQSWLNVYHKGGYIDWHGHTPPALKAWHGFLCVDVEPDSSTSYRWPGVDEVVVKSSDGLIVMGESAGDLHRSSEWLHEDRPRITIAFDIVPLSAFQTLISDSYTAAARSGEQSMINHWLPI